MSYVIAHMPFILEYQLEDSKGVGSRAPTILVSWPPGFPIGKVEKIIEESALDCQTFLENISGLLAKDTNQGL